MEDFTIDKAGWHTRNNRNWEFDTSIVYTYFKNLISYLQAHKLTTREILGDGEVATDETQIMASDLTEEGLLFVKAVYRGQWINKVVDGKITPTDYRLLDKALAKLRV